MAGGKSDFLELELLDHVLGNAAYSAPATVYIALYTATPSDAGGGTEVSGGSYVRKSVANNATQWPAAAAGAKANGEIIEFVEASADWGEIQAFGIHDAVTAGNMMYWGPISPFKTVLSGDTAKFPVGDINITED